MSQPIETLKNISVKFFDSDVNESSDLEKTWSELNEYILDTLDYLQLHQEDLREFYQLAENCLTQLDQYDLAQQIELLNRKGELLLQSSTIDIDPNPIENLLETIHRTMKMSSSSDPTIEDQLDELDGMMNELSELIVSSTTDPISAKPMKLAEQILDSTVVKNELEKRQISLEEIRTKIVRHHFDSNERLLILFLLY